MYCKYCGSKNNKNVKFCASCGKAIGEEEVVETTVKPVSNTNGESFFQKNKGVIAVAAVIVIVLFLLGNGNGKGNGSSSPEAASKQFLEGLKTCNTKKVFNSIYSEEHDVSELTAEDKKQFMDNMCGMVDGYKILDSDIDGDEAEVEVRITGDGDSDEGTFYLVKVRGKWYIDMDRTF